MCRLDILKILGDSSFSNHHPISLLINLNSSSLGGSSWNVNARFTQEIKEHVKALWETFTPQMLSSTKLRKVVKYYEQFCIAKVVEARLEESRLRRSLEFWQTLVHFDAQNEANKFAIKDLWSQLITLTNQEGDGHRIRFETRWMKSEDRMDKYIFSLVKEHMAGGLITELFDKDDTLVSSQADLAKVCNTFYSKLNAYPTTDTHREECCAELLKIVHSHG